MTKVILIASFFISFCFSSQGQILNTCDGPYAFYQNDQVILRSIMSDSIVSIDSFKISDKNKHTLSIHFSNHTGWDFTVPFRKKIENEPTQWKQGDKIFAVSDIEGEFEAFRNLLIQGKVMDSSYQWIFGNGHLVICGDLFDRGKDVIPELWLLYKLEDEARIAGGYVHTILGNHDIMNLSGDLRYVQPKYFEHAKLMGLNYSDLFASDTELGRWLRSKNIIEKIDDNLYLHGGISSQILNLRWTIEDINAHCQPFYDQGMHPEKFPDEELWSFFDGHNISPFWYRGYFLEPKATQGLVDSTLAFYHCNKIIVGHDIIDNVSSFYHSKVIGIDVNEHLRNGKLQGLLIVGNSMFVVYEDGRKVPLKAMPEPDVGKAQ